MIEATLSHPTRTEGQTVDVAFPIKDYNETYRKLAVAGMTSATERESRILSIDSGYGALEGLRGTEVNIDELDYLAKRLDSFSEPEARQFDGVASAKGIADIEGLINLTFSCQQATVISDFSNLRAVGKAHYLNTHDGHASVADIEALDGEAVARELILNNAGTVTPYGVVYDNGMELEQLYTGRAFPGYLYEPPLLTLDVTKKSAQGVPVAFLCLPMPDVCLERLLERSGLDNPADMILDIEVMGISSDVFRWIEPLYESPQGINGAARVISALDEKAMAKLCAAAEYIEPRNAGQLRELAERAEQFEFYEGVTSAEEYGRKRILEMGCFMRDAEMDEFYDFEGFGKRLMETEQGEYIDGGYVRYDGDVPLEDLFPQTRQTLEQTMGM